MTVITHRSPVHLCIIIDQMRSKIRYDAQDNHSLVCHHMSGHDCDHKMGSCMMDEGCTPSSRNKMTA